MPAAKTDNQGILANTTNSKLRKSKKDRNSTCYYQIDKAQAASMNQHASSIMNNSDCKENQKVSEKQSAFTQKQLTIESLIKDKNLNGFKYAFKKLANA